MLGPLVAKVGNGVVGDGVADMASVVGGVVDRGVVGYSVVGSVVDRGVVDNGCSVVGRGSSIGGGGGVCGGRGVCGGGGIGRGGGVCGGRGVCRGSRDFKFSERSERLLGISQGEKSRKTKHLEL